MRSEPGVRSRHAALIMVTLLTVTAGCTRGEAGEAQPAATAGASSGPHGTSESSVPGSSSPNPSMPPRPKDLALDGVKPCSLFTEPQLDALQVDKVRESTNSSQQYKGMLECILNVQRQQPFYAYSVTAVTSEGIAPWLSGKRNVEAKLTSVGGYAAATYWIRGANGTNTNGCSTAVDVATDQQLMIFTNNDGGHSFTLEQLCERAEKAAGLAVETLRTLR